MTACIVCVCVPEVVHISDLLHAQPTELTSTHCTVHSVAAAIISLHDVGTTTWTGLDLLCIFKIKSRTNILASVHQTDIRLVPQCLCPTTRLLVEDVERGNIIGSWRVTSALTPGLVTSLVWVPQLAAVVAKLGFTAFPTTAQLGALGTAVSYHCIANEW